MKTPNAKRAIRQINADEVRAALDQQSRDPFRDLLADVLGSAPAPEAMHALAQRNPDRYGQLLAIVARLAGYNEKLEVEANVTTRVKDMSDAELELRLAELERAQPLPHPAVAAKPQRQPKKARPKLVFLKQPPGAGSEAANGSGSAA
jgi:hypothetical protein